MMWDIGHFRVDPGSWEGDFYGKKMRNVSQSTSRLGPRWTKERVRLLSEGSMQKQELLEARQELDATSEP